MREKPSRCHIAPPRTIARFARGMHAARASRDIAAIYSRSAMSRRRRHQHHYHAALRAWYDEVKAGRGTPRSLLFSDVGHKPATGGRIFPAVYRRILSPLRSGRHKRRARRRSFRDFEARAAHFARAYYRRRAFRRRQRARAARPVASAISAALTRIREDASARQPSSSRRLLSRFTASFALAQPTSIMAAPDDDATL